jgi:hypothetical protein
LDVESKYYLNSPHGLRSLILWDKIWKNLKKLNKIWFIYEKSIILFQILFEPIKHTTLDSDCDASRIYLRGELGFMIYCV